jgi:ribosome-binding factor A
MASFYRVNRMRELFMRETTDIIRRLKDPRIRFVTVIDTELSRDLSFAKIFVNVMGDDEEQKQVFEALKNSEGFIRRQLAQRIPLRYIPEIRLEYDYTAERAARIETLLSEIHVRDGD